MHWVDWIFVMGGTPLGRLDCIRPLRRCIRPRAQKGGEAQCGALAARRVRASLVPTGARAARWLVRSRSRGRVRVAAEEWTGEAGVAACVAAHIVFALGGRFD